MDAKNVYLASENELREKCGLGQKQLDGIASYRTLEEAKRIYENCQKLGIHILTVQDEQYPLKAQNGNDVPVLLFYKGNMKKIGRQ